ncbi:Zn-dependent exopeptidase [Mycena venus]|uniref:Zn-dependent exopeptidase n=1 Tax=Mycena venus TaxID=2733690 RepID=A0A8H7CVY6_9AGAR|nr:Zn-dependent exopeptidase [Mycena venus]
MSKDPEKTEAEDELVVDLPRRSRLRELLRRIGLVLAILLCVRVVQVYRAAHSSHAQFRHRPHHHNQRPGGWRAPQGHVSRPQRWHERPQPRLSMEEREKLFLSIPDPESARAASKEYTAHAHPAGSAHDEQDALRMLKTFQDALQIPPPDEAPVFPAGSKQSRWATLGLTSALFGPREPTAWVDIYYPIMDTGREQRLEILDVDGSPIWNADLVEDGDPLDADAHKHRNSVPTWHGASGDGDVQGQLIYANYGTYADYAELVAAGTNFTGKIVLTRYGHVLRGLKVKGAEDLGAVGVIMYDDPRDDGHIIVENGFEPYPAGPARNPTAVQRGSVAYINLYAGDPSTPGLPAYPDSNRTEGSNGPRIPSLPISWANAQRLLAEIDGGADARRLTGRASNAAVRLVNHVDARVMPIWNTMAAIPGHVRDEVVVIGCHRDAWVLGATDPISGTASLHEVVRGYGALLKAGWKPLRTIVFASWDAEEYGLIGSTEYGEDFAAWLAEHAIAYVNVDGSAGGSRWGADASPSLSHLILDTARDVPHPTIPGKSLFDAQDDDGPISIDVAGAQVDTEYMAAYEAAETARRRREAKGGLLRTLGSGSDFTVFLEHLGIASSNEGFGRTPQDAVYHYHSIYDTQRWQELHADPGFHRATAVAKHLGLMLLRLTDSIIVPLNTTQYTLELHNYLDEVEEIVTDTPLATAMDFSRLRESISELTAASIELDAEKEAAEKEFTKLLSQLPKFPRRYGRRRGFTRHFIMFVKRVFGVAPGPDRNWHGRAGLHVPAAWEEYLDAQFSTDRRDPESDNIPRPHLPRTPPIFRFIKAARRVTKANKKLAAFERGFVSEEGIKGREWYKHQVVAPGRWLGYGATTLPGLNEALAIDKDVVLARQEAERLIALFTKLAEDLRA